MSELVSNPQELAQQLADQHRAAQAEAAVHQFVDVTNEESLNDFNSYLESRPTEDATEDATEDVGTDMLKKSHYDETLAETANQYEEMSMTELAKELAEATVAKDTTKFTDVSEVLNGKVANFVDAQKSERTEDSELPAGNRDEQVKNVYNRLGKVMEAEKSRLTAEKQPEPTPDTSTGTGDVENAQTNFDKLSPTQKLVKLAEIEPLLDDALAKAVEAGDNTKIEQYKRHKEQLQNEKNRALEAKFQNMSSEELLHKLENLTDESDKVEHDQVRDEIHRRFTEARTQDAPEQNGTAAEKKNSFDQMTPSEKLARIAEIEAIIDTNIVTATESGDIEELNALKENKEALQVLKNEALKAKFEGVSVEELQKRYDTLTNEADKEEREQVRLEMWRRYGEATSPENTATAVADLYDQDAEGQRPKRKGWMKRIKDRVKGSRATTAVLTGNVVDGGNGGNGNNDTPEKSRLRGCGAVLGAAALVGAAVVFGVVAKQKGWDINPFDGDGFSFDNGVGIKSPYNEKFYDYISGTAKFKEANPTVTLPGGEVVSWIPDAPNYDLAAYDQYMNGLIDQMNS